MNFVPKDFQRALRQSGLHGFFVECPYVPRAEYVRWVSAAKRPSTRRIRIQHAVVRLFAQWMEEMKVARATLERPSVAISSTGDFGGAARSRRNP